MNLELKNYKSLLFVIILILGIFSLAKNSQAATGTSGSQGGIFYVEGVDGIVGWARGASEEVISVDYYITRRGDPLTATSWICSAGSIPANQSLSDDNNRFSGHQGRLFASNGSCLRDLPDGDYDLYLALGPNLFALLSPPNRPEFWFSVRTIDSISHTRLWMHYLGVMINRQNGLYDSYPTVMKDGSTYKMWYVSPVCNYGDTIFYAESNNGISWNLINGPSDCGTVLHPTSNTCVCSDSGTGGTCNFFLDDMHTADPSVIKVGSTYYMYYTGASKQFSCFGSNNRIFLAMSPDGRNWTKRATNGNPQAVISPQNPCPDIFNCRVGYYSGWYGAGQSSVIYRDITGDGHPEFIHYFSDWTTSTMAQSLALSTDGITFQNPQNGVTGEATWDVKYQNYLTKYVQFNAIPTNQGQPGYIMFQSSGTGLPNSWIGVGQSEGGRQVLIKMDSFTNDQNHWVINNGGLLGNPVGTITDRNTIFYFGAGQGMQPLETTWDIAGVDVWFSKDSDAAAPASPVNLRVQ